MRNKRGAGRYDGYKYNILKDLQMSLCFARRSWAVRVAVAGRGLSDVIANVAGSGSVTSVALPPGLGHRSGYAAP